MTDRKPHLSEHEMLVTLANMALIMDDLTPHDIIESLQANGYGHVVAESRAMLGRRKDPEDSEDYE